MKKIFKLLPVALGLIALASCSSDDLFNEGGAVAQIETQGDAANVGVEDLYSTGITRSAHTASKALKWVTGDQFRIYDAELSKFDTYEFSAETSAFTRKYTTQRVANDAITYAVFPGENVSWTNFDESNGEVKVVMTIPTVITYNGSSEKNFDGTLAYVSNLPMTGAAQYDETYGAKVPQMKYMTAVLAVTLDNAQSKATWLKLSADKPLSGNFEAVLKDEAVLTKSADAATIVAPKNYIYVNIADAPRSRAIVYLPVIVDTYTSLKVEYTTADSYTIANIESTDNPTSGSSPIAWTPIKDFVGSATSFTTTRGGSKQANSVLDAAFDFKLDTHTPEALTTVLSDRRDVTGALNLNIDYLEFSKAGSESPDAKWYTIKVPNMKADEVHIKMPTGIKNDTKNRSKLVIADADATNPYTGKIIFDLESTGAITNGTNKLEVEVNLKEAAIDMVGDWSDADGGITFKAANNITFGDGTTATKLNETPSFTTDVKGKLTIAANAAVNNPSSAFVSIGTSSITDVDIQGYIGYINTKNATTVMSGAGQADIMIVEGNTEFNLASEAIAVKNSLTVQQPVTITMKQGYINKLVMNNIAAFTPDAKVCNVKLNNGTEQGNVAFGSIVASASFTPASGKTLYNYITFTESQWNGKPIGATFTTTYAADGDIYTANELASAPAATAKTLRVDVDLQGKNWTPIATSTAFDGNGKTIKNLELTAAERSASTFATHAGIGLFSKVSAAVDIKDFTLEGVNWKPLADLPASSTETKKYSDFANVGSVAGIVSANANFYGITVTGATLDGSNRTDVFNVGGLIGLATAGINIGGTAAGQTNSVTAAIKGYYSLGGLIGSVAQTDANTITVQKNTVVPTFVETTSLASGMNSDDNFGKIGDLIGSIDDATGIVEVKNTNTITAFVASNRAALNFNQHKNYYIKSTTPTVVQEQYFTGDAQTSGAANLVGFSVTGALFSYNGTSQTNSVAGASGTNYISTNSKAWNMFTTTAY